MIRVVFMGSPAFAVPSLTALCERPDLCTVVGVVTQPDRPQGRGQKLAPPPVKVAALARGLEIWQPEKVKTPEALATLSAFKPDLVVVAAYGRILPTTWLQLPKLGCINVHASLLPKYRGASPILQAVLNGDSEAGVAIMHMVQGLDAGAVYGQRAIPVAPDETTQSLTVKLAEVGAKLLVELLPAITAQTLVPQAQDESKVTLAPLIDKEMAHLDFKGDAVQLERAIRAYQPWPLAFAKLGEQRVQILSAQVVELPLGRTLPPGELWTHEEGQVYVGCGTKALLLVSVKPEGRPAMSAQAWILGRGAKSGDQLA